jgi:hypothetical protein
MPREGLRETLLLAGVALMVTRTWPWAPVMGLGFIALRLLIVKPTSPPSSRGRYGSVLGLTAALVLLIGAGWLRGVSSWVIDQEEQLYLAVAAESIATNGPERSTFLLGYRFLYHWVGMAWAGALAGFGGVDVFDAVLRVVPAVTSLMLALCVLCIARAVVLHRSRTASVAVVAAATCSGFLGRSGVTLFGEGIATGLGTACLVVGLLHLASPIERSFRCGVSVSLWFAVLSFLATGAKAMSGILLAVAAVVGLIAPTSGAARGRLGLRWAGASGALMGSALGMWVFFDVPFTPTRGGARLALEDPMSFVRTSVGDARDLTDRHYWLMATMITLGLVLPAIVGLPRLSAVARWRWPLLALSSVGFVLAIGSTTDQFAEQIQFWIPPAAILAIFAVVAAHEDVSRLDSLQRAVVLGISAALASGYLSLRENLVDSGSTDAIRIRGASVVPIVAAPVLSWLLLVVLHAIRRRPGEVREPIRRVLAPSIVTVSVIFGAFVALDAVRDSIASRHTVARDSKLLPTEDERAVAEYLSASAGANAVVATSRPGELGSWRITALCGCQMLASTRGFWGNVVVDREPWSSYVARSERLQFTLDAATLQPLRDWGVTRVLLRADDLGFGDALDRGRTLYANDSYAVLDVGAGVD